jgi:hypothetical protein
MVADGELMRFLPPDETLPNLYALPGTRERINKYLLYGHEMDCADAFTALKLNCGPRLVRWQRYQDLHPDLRRAYDRYKVKPDRIFELDDIEQVFHIEEDRGTEDLNKQVAPKIENYIRMSDAHPGQGFVVLFLAQGYRYHAEDQERANELYQLVSRYNRGKQFLVALHSAFTAAPVGPIFNCPAQHNLSIESL